MRWLFGTVPINMCQSTAVRHNPCQCVLIVSCAAQCQSAAVLHSARQHVPAGSCSAQSLSTCASRQLLCTVPVNMCQSAAVRHNPHRHVPFGSCSAQCPLTCAIWQLFCIVPFDMCSPAAVLHCALRHVPAGSWCCHWYISLTALSYCKHCMLLFCCGELRFVGLRPMGLGPQQTVDWQESF